MTSVLLGMSWASRPGAGPTTLLDTARRAEDAGFAGIVLPEHVVMGPRTDRYAWGRFPAPVDAPWLDPLVALTAIGAVTTSLRLCTGILIAPLRNAPVLAKAVATLDVLSGGRVELGVGTGWQQEEFDAAGLDFAARGRLLTDTMATCRALWSLSPATIGSTEIWCEPKPVRGGGPPVLFSGTLVPRNVRRIVELGDGWIPIMGATHDDVVNGVARLRAALADVGRDQAQLLVRAHPPLVTGDLAATVAGGRALVEAGVTDLAVPLGAFVRDESELVPFFESARRALR